MVCFNANKRLRGGGGPMTLDVAFTLECGEFLSIHGRSGVGKTTLLRIMAGLTNADEADIVVDGETWDSTDKRIRLPVQKRSIGFVFQDFALFPNLTVRGNLAFALPVNGDGKIIDELIELMELRAFEKARPAELSGGQQQRVALSRAIVRKPKLLLLDEPLSALDDEMRLKLQEYILIVHRRFNCTTILVSHSIPEIYRLSNMALMLENGKVERLGRPEDVFSGRNLSSKFRLTGEIVGIRQADLVYIISVLAGNDIVQVVATGDEVEHFAVGKKVLVASKAFNPIITAL